MGVITISREYGSDGRTVARKVAEALSYHNIDKELLVEVAQKAQVPVSEVERYDELPEHPALRILRKFLTWIRRYLDGVVGVRVVGSGDCARVVRPQGSGTDNHG